VKVDALEALVTSQQRSLATEVRSSLVQGVVFENSIRRSLAAKTNVARIGTEIERRFWCEEMWHQMAVNVAARVREACCVEMCRACNERICAGSGPDWSHFLGTQNSGVPLASDFSPRSGNWISSVVHHPEAPIRSLVASPSCNRCTNVKMTARLVELSIALLRDTPRVNAIERLHSVNGASVGFYT
jgi:hypothetical protein